MSYDTTHILRFYLSFKAAVSVLKRCSLHCFPVFLAILLTSQGIVFDLPALESKKGDFRYSQQVEREHLAPASKYKVWPNQAPNESEIRWDPIAAFVLSLLFGFSPVSGSILERSVSLPADTSLSGLAINQGDPGSIGSTNFWNMISGIETNANHNASSKLDLVTQLLSADDLIDYQFYTMVLWVANPSKYKISNASEIRSHLKKLVTLDKRYRSYLLQSLLFKEIPHAAKGSLLQWILPFDFDANDFKIFEIVVKSMFGKNQDTWPNEVKVSYDRALKRNVEIALLSLVEKNKLGSPQDSLEDGPSVFALLLKDLKELLPTLKAVPSPVIPYERASIFDQPKVAPLETEVYFIDAIQFLNQRIRRGNIDVSMSETEDFKKLLGKVQELRPDSHLIFETLDILSFNPSDWDSYYTFINYIEGTSPLQDLPDHTQLLKAMNKHLRRLMDTINKRDHAYSKSKIPPLPEEWNSDWGLKLLTQYADNIVTLKLSQGEEIQVFDMIRQYAIRFPFLRDHLEKALKGYKPFGEMEKMIRLRILYNSLPSYEPNPSDTASNNKRPFPGVQEEGGTKKRNDSLQQGEPPQEPPDRHEHHYSVIIIACA